MNSGWEPTLILEYVTPGVKGFVAAFCRDFEGLEFLVATIFGSAPFWSFRTSDW
jgi:hypothetical protein